MKLNIPEISSKYFNYHIDEKEFTAEVSTIECYHKKFYGQIWDDACDVGFNMKSSKTGNIVLFILSHIEKDKEGDLLYWKFKSYDDKYTVIIFND